MLIEGQLKKEERIMSQSEVDAWKQEIARLEVKESRCRREDYPVVRQELGDAHQKLGEEILKSGPPTRDRLQQAANEYAVAGDIYNSMAYQATVGTASPIESDDEAETYYQRALIAEKFGDIDGPHHYAGAVTFYKSAVSFAKNKKSYYQAKLDEYLRRRGMTP
jgi:hypothetical protein